MKAQLIANSRCVVGEGPLWVRHLSRLLWTDLRATHMHLLQTETETWETVETEAPVMSVAETNESRLLIATPRTVQIKGAIPGNEGILTLSSPAVRFNDAQCDPEGRLWIGSKSTIGRPEQGNLYRIANGDAEIVLSGLSVPNGMGWSPDGRTMYVTDSGTGRVDAFDFDSGTGRISRRRRFITIDPAAGRPDGLAVDVEGGVWIALWGGSRVERYDSDGHRSELVEVPVAYVTSCAFGGVALDRLYITTAAVDASREGIRQGAGGLFAVDPNVFGQPVGRYEESRATARPAVRPADGYDDRSDWTGGELMQCGLRGSGDR